MPDPTRLEAVLRARHPEAWVRDHLDSFPAAYFEAFGPEDVARHLDLSRRLDDENPVFVRTWQDDEQETEARRWWVEVVGYDAFQLLSTLCDLLAVSGLAIVEGCVFTSQPMPPREPSPAPRRSIIITAPGPGMPPSRKDAKAREPDRRPKIVDRFLVRQEATQADDAAPDWSAFEAELRAFVRLLRRGQHDQVRRRLIGRVAASIRQRRGEEPALEPLDLTIEPAADGSATLVHIAARDSFGLLALTAGALALCGIMIVRASIRTGEGRAVDTLWVTDREGRAMSEEATLRPLRRSLILIEHFSSRLHRAANPEAALVHFSRFVNDTLARPPWSEELAALDRPEVLDALVKVLGESDFLWEDYLLVRPGDLLPLIANPAEWRRLDPAELSAELASALADAHDHEARAQALRRFRDRAIFRAGFRAIVGIDGDEDSLEAELSDAAEVLLRAAHAVALDEVRDAWSRRADDEVPLPASALFALGKCGGRELGFGSDLEMMLVYDDRQGAALSMGPTFDGLVATLRRLLAGRRGMTFELDFRLRPYGHAGAPATALGTFAEYYRGGGPAWGYERQALIKLRAIAGDPALIAEVEALRDRFVYGPEPFDRDGLRRLRRLQVAQYVPPGRINAKFSPGALVDLEYLVQALQITHGGHDPRLRTPSTLKAIAALVATGRLDPATAGSLRDGYRFFRSLIDALRVVHGHAQDLTVPPPDSDEFLLLARRMRRDTPSALRDELERRLASVRGLLGHLEATLRPDLE